MKIAIAVPMPNHVPHAFIRNLIEIITYTEKLPGVTSVNYIDRSGVRTDRNRNVMINESLLADMDYILWLDADMTYPMDIVEKYLNARPFDVIGCVYFKRKPPYDPVLYIDGPNPLKPYRAVDPTTLKKDSIVEVDGLGFGGVMVNCDVYRKMGDDKWMKYGENFHLPYETEGQLTHDLLWCKKAKEYGFKMLVHTGVYAKHYEEVGIGLDEFLSTHNPEPKTVTVIMPTIHPRKAKQTAKILSSRAGYPHEMLVVQDDKKEGFASICNHAVINKADYYVYVSDDIFPSRNWLSESLKAMAEDGLLGYNDGKWDGRIATSGMVSRKWMLKNYGGNMFFPEYFGHYNDVELTMIAMEDKKYFYNPAISMVEVDYEKEKKAVHTPDKVLFAKRKENGFDGKVSNKLILENYK